MITIQRKNVRMVLLSLYSLDVHIFFRDLCNFPVFMLYPILAHPKVFFSGRGYALQFLKLFFLHLRWTTDLKTCIVSSKSEATNSYHLVYSVAKHDPELTCIKGLRKHVEAPSTLLMSICCLLFIMRLLCPAKSTMATCVNSIRSISWHHRWSQCHQVVEFPPMILSMGIERRWLFVNRCSGVEDLVVDVGGRGWCL